MALVQGSACGTDLVESVVGRYALVSVDGETLPAALEEGGQITGGQLEFESNHECDLRLDISTGTVTDTCVWSRTGATVLLTWADDDIALMTFIEDQITWTREGLELVFER